MCGPYVLEHFSSSQCVTNANMLTKINLQKIATYLSEVIFSSKQTLIHFCITLSHSDRAHADKCNVIINCPPFTSITEIKVLLKGTGEVESTAFVNLWDDVGSGLQSIPGCCHFSFHVTGCSDIQTKEVGPVTAAISSQFGNDINCSGYGPHGPLLANQIQKAQTVRLDWKPCVFPCVF